MQLVANLCQMYFSWDTAVVSSAYLSEQKPSISKSFT